MFTDNKYTTWYYSIIAKADNINTGGYVERHHIIPKSLGGSNDQSNIATLTAKEHFVCHLLLTKMVVGMDRKRMFNALRKMSHSKSTQQRITLTSRQFQYLSEGLSVYNKGQYNHMYGKTHTKEVKNLLSKLHKGKIISKDHINRIKESNTGINNFFYGKNHTKETTKLMKAAWQDRPELECPHCGLKSKNTGNMNRWHFSNCKKLRI